MSGLLARAQRSYTESFWRIEVRSGKAQTKQNKRRETNEEQRGAKASTQAAVF